MCTFVLKNFDLKWNLLLPLPSFSCVSMSLRVVQNLNIAKKREKNLEKQKGRDGLMRCFFRRILIEFYHKHRQTETLFDGIYKSAHVTYEVT